MQPVIGAVVTMVAGAVSTVLALESPVTPDWANLSVGVAAIVGLVYVVRTMRGVFKDSAESDAKRDGSQRVADTARDGILREVVVSLATVSEQMRGLHDDNALVARELARADRATAARLVAADAKVAGTLAEADKGVTRKVEEQNQSALRKRLDEHEEENP